MAFRLVNREKLLAPYRCILCERTPSARVVDTGYNLIRGVPVAMHMRGRKYICETCGEFVAKAFGYLNHHQAATMKEEIIRLQNDLEAAKQMGHLNDVLNKFYDEFARRDEDAAPEAEVEVENDSSA